MPQFSLFQYFVVNYIFECCRNNYFLKGIEINGGLPPLVLHKIPYGVTPLFFPYIENRVKIIVFAAL